MPPYLIHLIHPEVYNESWPLRKRNLSTEPWFIRQFTQLRVHFPGSSVARHNTQLIKCCVDFQEGSLKGTTLASSLLRPGISVWWLDSNSHHREDRGQVLRHSQSTVSPWTAYLQTYCTWVLCNMHSDILLTNSEELENRVKEIFKKMNLKIKKW